MTSTEAARLLVASALLDDEARTALLKDAIHETASTPRCCTPWPARCSRPPQDELQRIALSIAALQAEEAAL